MTQHALVLSDKLCGCLAGRVGGGALSATRAYVYGSDYIMLIGPNYAKIMLSIIYAGLLVVPQLDPSSRCLWSARRCWPNLAWRGWEDMPTYCTLHLVHVIT